MAGRAVAVGGAGSLHTLGMHLSPVEVVRDIHIRVGRLADLQVLVV